MNHSTDNGRQRVENHDGFEGWLAHINSACGAFYGQLLNEAFHGTLEEFSPGTMKLSTVSASGAAIGRRRQELARSRDDCFYAVFQLEGEAEMEQADGRALLRPGDISLIDAARPSLIRWRSHSRQISLLLPRQMLELSGPLAPECCARRLAHNLPVVKLGHQLLQESLRNSALTPVESQAALGALACLLRPVLGKPQAQPSRHEQRFQQVTGLIEENLASGELSPEWLAAEAGMSVRSLYRLFAGRGMVVSRYIRNQRLDKCAQALRDADTEEKLASLAWRWGFTDHSHFSTAFRQRFGVTPGEYRRRHR
jgi:AraC family transcriptional activator of tynA and feaB